MTAQEAFHRLDAQKWAATPAQKRLQLLTAVRSNLKKYAAELAASDGEMKNDRMGEKLFSDPESMISTAVPIANTLSACIRLYKSLVKGEMLKPIRITKVKEGLYDIQVFPQEAKDKLISGSQKAYIRVKGAPKQVNPLDKPPGVIAVLGAGNYSSALEMVKALFLENCAVIHKPHHLNEKTDAVWAKIFQPVADAGALRFCRADQGRALTELKGLSKIYFTGGTGTAKAIMGATDTPLISECGGNHPCIIVPGDRPWTQREMHHQAVQIATISKLNGGAVCGRPQTLVTSKHWPQREAFLAELKKAIAADTPAAGTYYPGSDKVRKDFQAHYPDAEILQPENGKYKSADYLFITDVAADGYAAKHEAFCQITGEVPLDVPAHADDFLPQAVAFCNSQLIGTLCSCILIDEDTRKNHEQTLAQAINDMAYGALAINTLGRDAFHLCRRGGGGYGDARIYIRGLIRSIQPF